MRAETTASPLWGSVQTSGTNSDKFEPVADDFIVGDSFQFMMNRYIKFRGRIIDPITVNAADVVMITSHTIKPFLRATQFKPLNFTAFGENFKITIDGSKADAWQTLTNHFVDLVSTGMGMYFLKFFQDDSTLARHPKI